MQDVIEIEKDFLGKYPAQDLAEIAYDAYAKQTDYKNFMGDPMPAWSALPDKIVRAWCAAAVAVETETINNNKPFAYSGMGA